MGGNPLAEIGMGADDKIAAVVDHTLLLQAPPTLEEPLRRAMISLAESSRDTSRAIKVLAFAGAAYLVMSGVAKIIEASRSGGSKSDYSSCDDFNEGENGSKSNVGGGNRGLDRDSSLHLSCISASDEA